MDTTTEALQIIVSAATAVGVFLAWRALLLTKRQAVATFEDSLTSDYREIAQRLPVAALLGEKLEESTQADALSHFYHYVDLTNEQVFLRQQGRITASIWQNWLEGIEHHLRRPAFQRAWQEIKLRAPESFAELRRLEDSGFRDDPRSWRRKPRSPALRSKK